MGAGTSTINAGGVRDEQEGPRPSLLIAPELEAIAAESSILK